MLPKLPAHSVLVYAKADRSLSLVPREVVRQEEQALGPFKEGGTIARSPFTKCMYIDIPAASSPYHYEESVVNSPAALIGGAEAVPAESTAATTGTTLDEKTGLSSVKREEKQENQDILYTTRIVFQSVAKHMAMKRLFGFVQEYVVVEKPLL